MQNMDYTFNALPMFSIKRLLWTDFHKIDFPHIVMYMNILTIRTQQFIRTHSKCNNQHNICKMNTWFLLHSVLYHNSPVELTKLSETGRHLQSIELNNFHVLSVINLTPTHHRKRAACKSTNGSHKYKGNSKDLKPPDLWIHHERLELKPMDKSPDPNPVMTDTPIPRTSQDITPVDSTLDNPVLQRRNSYRGKFTVPQWGSRQRNIPRDQYF